MAEYSILIQYDSVDKIYVARIPELNGCMAHGNTQEEALRELKIALELWVETAVENSMTLPMPMLFAH